MPETASTLIHNPYTNREDWRSNEQGKFRRRKHNLSISLPCCICTYKADQCGQCHLGKHKTGIFLQDNVLLASSNRSRFVNDLARSVKNRCCCIFTNVSLSGKVALKIPMVCFREATKMKRNESILASFDGMRSKLKLERKSLKR